MNTPVKLTEQQKQDRQQYRENIASGRHRFRLSNELAAILGAGNEAGYADALAGHPPRQFDASTDFVFVRGYESGRRLFSKGKQPQIVTLKAMGHVAARLNLTETADLTQSELTATETLEMESEPA